jgi:tRNA(Ile)-lysidine synthase
MILQQLKNHIIKHLAEYFSETKSGQPHILVGLSGGPDSVFLLYLLHQLVTSGTITLSAAHLDHGWRTTSASDVLFCKNLCDQLGIPFYTQHAQDLPIAIKSNGSQEELGRKLRRHFFSTVQKQTKADLIALAHHQQDQQETFFMRLMRGTSLSGLCGMSTFNGCYFRPLLDTPKSSILDFLEHNNIPYLTDPTNNSDAYLRNRIRHHVLPALQLCDERFDQKFSSTLQLLHDEHNFLTTLALESFHTVFSAQPPHKQMRGDQPRFASLHPVLKNRVIITWLIAEKIPFQPHQRHLLEIIKFLSSPNGGSHQLGPTWTVFKKNRFFWIQHHK